VEMVNVLAIHVLIWNIIRRGWGKTENSGGDESNCTHIWKYHSQTSLYTYEILIKMLKKNLLKKLKYFIIHSSPFPRTKR
jgi:hypothetical protein